MKNSRAFTRFISVLCALSIFAVQPGFAASRSVTKLKSAGRTANSIPNTILNGSIAPTKSVGINGDFYIDTKNLNIYGPKKNNVWPNPMSLRGVAGVAGSDGKSGSQGAAGSDGKTITNTSTVQGSAGATGATGATGSAGATGIAGANGANGESGAAGVAGAAGANGSNGETGAAGAAGVAGSTGANGATGASGSAGPAGPTGATGPTGPVGSQGVSGVTSVSVGKFNFINTLTGTAGSSAQSNNFGGMSSGKKYLMHLVISGVNSNFDDIAATLILEISSTVGVIPITTAYYVSGGRKYVSPGTRFTQNIHAELVIDGTLVTETFNLFAKVSASEGLSSVVSLSGYYSLTEVGSIS